MDEWMDGTDGRTDGLIDGWMGWDGSDEWMDEMDGRTGGSMDG